MPYRCLLFDLDNCLYDERQFMTSGLAFLAGRIAQDHRLDPAAVAELFLNELADRYPHVTIKQLVQDCLSCLSLTPSNSQIHEYIRLYHTHHPSIKLYEGARETLEQLRPYCTLLLITNGNKTMQQNKISALDIAEIFNEIYYCDEAGAPKPSAFCVLSAISEAGIARSDCLLIGDNPDSDGAAANAARIAFLRIMTDKYRHISHTGPTIQSILDLPSFLRESQY